MQHPLLRTIASALALVAIGCGGQPDVGDQTEFSKQTVERPPQFVLLAFDGSKSLSFWEASRTFARENDVKFTYFISGVYFLTSTTKKKYDGPGYKAGASWIGFGKSNDDIAERLRHIEAAHQEGHEIASHANGHFDGSEWSKDDWLSEHAQFDQLVFNAGENNSFDAPALSFTAEDVVGFRAPLLGRSSGLYPSLAEHGFSYDTSRVRGMSHWPTQIDGVWDFPLAALRIVGSGKRTLSMDYNFYVAQSGAKPNAANKAQYRQEMVDTYMAYFENNYFGNRAPIDIGHHFSRWNGGAYWEAMQEFAQRVCGLPEVQCGTYKELVTFLEENPDKIQAYRDKRFTQMPKPPSGGGDEIEELSEAEIAELVDADPHHACDDEEVEE